MPRPRDSQRIVIAGASSLLGAELKSLLEESRFAGWDLSLVDEETVAGTLTEAAGEPAVIQPVEESTFDRANCIFFAGSAAFTERNLSIARESGAIVIDLSGALASQSGSSPWFSAINVLHAGTLSENSTAYFVPSAAATAASALSLGLASLGLQRLTFLAFQPVSAAGRAGIEELESQTSQLLSLQSVGKPVFDAQVAFAMLDQFGPASSQNLLSARERIRDEIEICLAGKVGLPAFQLIHVPVFYGLTFAACAQLAPETNNPGIVKALNAAGFVPVAEKDQGLSNVSVAGESRIQLADPEADPAGLGTWWFWGAADDIRLPATTAIKLAEKLVE
jgi:aspartate-semialdehyde dehydrogenase